MGLLYDGMMGMSIYD